MPHAVVATRVEQLASGATAPPQVEESRNKSPGSAPPKDNPFTIKGRDPALVPTCERPGDRKHRGWASSAQSPDSYLKETFKRTR
jgi:hypothetical protein